MLDKEAEKTELKINCHTQLISMLEVRNLTVKYRGCCALTEVSLALKPGELVGLVGPNGAGKSTLIKAMLGLVEAHSGAICYNCQPLKEQLHRIAYVPQRSQIDWNYPITVQNVVMLARTRQRKWLQRPTRQSREVVKQALMQVDLWELRDRPIGELSGGQQQRAFLARSLAQQADILFFDEPFNGVDRKTQNIMFDIFEQLKRENKTLLVISHDLSETIHCYDKLLLLNRQLVAIGTPKQVLTATNFQRAYGHHLNLISA
nr:metal ABC transporter ATP-binding protein [Lusitaniella coriacea]